MQLLSNALYTLAPFIHTPAHEIKFYWCPHFIGQLDSSSVYMDQINLEVVISQTTSNRMKPDDTALEALLCLSSWSAQSKTG